MGGLQDKQEEVRATKSQKPLYAREVFPFPLLQMCHNCRANFMHSVKMWNESRGLAPFSRDQSLYCVVGDKFQSGKDRKGDTVRKLFR